MSLSSFLWSLTQKLGFVYGLCVGHQGRRWPLKCIEVSFEIPGAAPAADHNFLLMMGIFQRIASMKAITKVRRPFSKAAAK